MCKRAVLYFLIIILGFSCQTVEKPEKPASFIPKDRMLELLIDIAIVKSGKDYDLKNIKEKGITPSDFVYKKHGIDSTVYKENNAWYAANPKIYHELFVAVRDTLTARKERFEEQLRIEDSLKNPGKKNNKSLSQQQKESIGKRKRSFSKTMGKKAKEQPKPKK